MVLQTFSWAIFGMGLAGLASVLFLLQRLRVRPREQSVPTLLFWREAVDETRARVLVQRFQHPWTYLLALALVGLAWFAMSDPVNEEEDRRRVVCLLDGSAAMAHGQRWDDAVSTLRGFVDGVDPRRREVLFCGSRVRPVLAPGEAQLLLKDRLAALGPEATPARIESVVRELVAGLGEHESCRLVVFGDARLRPEFLDGLPARVEVQRATSSPRPLAGNRGVTALGIAESESGRWSTVDVLCVVEGEGASNASLRAALDGGSYDAAPQIETPDDRHREWRWRDVPARGGRFSVQLQTSDLLTLDDGASVDLPSRPAIDVFVALPLEDRVGGTIDADQATRRVAASDADVMVVAEADPDRPALLFAAAADQPAFRIVVPEDLDHDAEQRLRELLAQLALDQFDASAMASAVQRPVSVQIEPGEVRRVEVWSELLEDRAQWTSSRAFPLFVARAIRWLADLPEIEPWLAVGEVSNGGVPLRAGEFDRVEGPAHASLFDRSLTRPDAAEDELSQAPGTTGSGPLGLVSWLLMAVFALLAADWVLFGRGRIP